MDLSDAWVVAVLSTKSVIAEDRGKNWPAVFGKKGILRADFVHKGQPAVLWDSGEEDFAPKGQV